jgi:hypothetical protein
MKSEILDNYIKAAEDFVSAAKAVEQQKLLLTPSNEEWPGAYVIHHMADFEVHFSHRFLRILTEDNPIIESYDESLYVDLLSYSTRGITASLDAVLAMRKLIHEVLSNSDEAVLDRPARHSVKGDIKLKNILQSATGHLNDHTAQLKAVTA